MTFPKVALLFLSTTAALLSAPPVEDARLLLGKIVNRGGLVLHLGRADGHLAVALHDNGRNLVQILDRDPGQIEKARAVIRSHKLYGPVSAVVWQEPFLPYVDNLVNLLVVEKEGLVDATECLRVLAPGGIVCVRGENGWKQTSKPAQKGTDEWTHYLYDASGNPAGNDQLVGPPKHLRWTASPTHTRSHEYTPGIWALISAGERIFYVQDKAPVRSQAAMPEWYLMARDAHNGLFLWEYPLKSWFSHLAGWTQSPIQLQRRMVTDGKRIYLPLSYHGPVSVLDAANGKLLNTFAETAGADEVIVHNNVLLVVTRAVSDVEEAEMKKLEDMAKRRGSPLEDRDSRDPIVREIIRMHNRSACSLVALDLQTGNLLWRKEGQLTGGLRRLSLRACGDHVHYHTNRGAICDDLRSGKEQWRRKGMPFRTLSAEGGICWNKEKVEMFSEKDGKLLWRQKSVLTQIRDVFILNNSVWIGGFKPYDTGRKKYTGPVWGPYFAVQRDITTGEVIQEITQENPGHHHRCYTAKATPHYILAGRRGTEFLDLDAGKVFWNSWARGTCRYGVMPANGMLYTPPHACACYLTARITGFNAMLAKRDKQSASTPRLAKGPAYADAEQPASDGDWPTYRADPSRSGKAKTSIPSQLKTQWKAQLDAAITAPTVAAGKVFVACHDEHRIEAFSQSSGKPAWNFSAAGRIDSPPTIHAGRVLFGSRDGSAYSLRATDGTLAWRFRGARDPRRLTSYGQLESISPAHGSVLLQDNVLCFTAGRSSFLDGGIGLCRLKPQTGELLSETIIYSPDPETGQQPKQYNSNRMPGFRSDILVADENYLYLRDVAFTKQGVETKEKKDHLFTLTDFTDASWPHRSYWIFGSESSISSGCSGQKRNLTYGRLLLFDKQMVYGYARGKVHWSNQFQDAPYRLFGRERGKPKASWGVQPPMQIRAMLLAEDKIFAAGPVLEHPDEPTVSKGALLAVFATNDGRELFRMPLPATPVFDGMAAAENRLYLSLENGTILCLAGQ